MALCNHKVSTAFPSSIDDMRIGLNRGHLTQTTKNKNYTFHGFALKAELLMNALTSISVFNWFWIQMLWWYFHIGQIQAKITISVPWRPHVATWKFKTSCKNNLEPTTTTTTTNFRHDLPPKQINKQLNMKRAYFSAGSKADETAQALQWNLNRGVPCQVYV